MILDSNHVDALRELINIGVGQAAGVLNQMVHSHIVLQVPIIKVLSLSQLDEEMTDFAPGPLATVKLSFTGPFSGIAVLVFKPKSASRLVSLLTGEDVSSPDLGSLQAETLSEVGNIVLNGVMGSVVNVLKQRLEFSLTHYRKDTITNLLRHGDSDVSLTILLARASFTIERQEIKGNVIVLFDTGTFEKLLAAIDAVHPCTRP